MSLLNIGGADFLTLGSAEVNSRAYCSWFGFRSVLSIYEALFHVYILVYVYCQHVSLYIHDVLVIVMYIGVVISRSRWPPSLGESAIARN